MSTRPKNGQTIITADIVERSSTMGRNVIAKKKEPIHIMTKEEIEEDMRQYKEWSSKVCTMIVIITLVALLFLFFCFVIREY